MSEEAPPNGRQGAPAADQHKTEPIPSGEFQSAPPTGNLGSADPQAPVPVAQSPVDGGVPRAQTERRGPAGRPGDLEPDASGDAARRSGDGTGPTGGRPSGEALPDSGGRVKE